MPYAFFQTTAPGNQYAYHTIVFKTAFSDFASKGAVGYNAYLMAKIEMDLGRVCAVYIILSIATLFYSLIT